MNELLAALALCCYKQVSFPVVHGLLSSLAPLVA